MERQVNFGHLAVHRTTTVTKEITRQYYCSTPEYSYFTGCSRGGGQAMMEAQRYPNDFDGIVSGAPAFDWPGLGAEFIQNIQAVFPDPSKLDQPVVTLSNLELLQNEVLLQCDAIDGVKDHILNNPRDCDFDFSQLPKCEGITAKDSCFTTSQLKAIKAIYAGIKSQQEEIYPGFPYGGEYEPGGWQSWIVGPFDETMQLGFPSLQFGFGTEIFKYLVFQEPAWNYRTYDFTDLQIDTQYAASYLNATSTNYIEFKQSEGKMIIWHGWNDPAISALSTKDHYNAAKIKDPSLENYIRLFLLPGVLHCGGGQGPVEVDWLDVIRAWVEKGEAPEKIIVTKTKDEKVTMTRPVFPYPEQAVYDGTDDPNNEKNFKPKRTDK